MTSISNAEVGALLAANSAAKARHGMKKQFLDFLQVLK